MKKKQTHLAYGIITGVVMSIVTMVMYMTGIAFNKPFISILIVLPISLTLLILNGVAYSKANEGFVTYGNVYGSCFKVSLIRSVFALALGIVILIAFPEYKDKTMEASRAMMEKMNGLSDDMIDKQIEMSRKTYSFSMTGGQLIFTIIGGAIASLIAAAIPKKLGERPFTADNF